MIDSLAVTLPLRDDITLFGWAVLLALALVSVFAATVTLYKLVQFLRLGVGRRRAAETAMALWLEGDGAGAMSRAAERSDVRLRVFHALLTGLSLRPGDADHAQARAGQAALEELALMSRSMRGLEAVVQAAPMLGLLGTVVGMIDAFGRLAEATGAVDPAVLAGGIWTALITTAVGLAIAIVFYFIALWLEARIGREREALERLIFVALNGPAAAAGSAR